MKIIFILIIGFLLSQKCIGQVVSLKKLAECPENAEFTKQKNCVFSISSKVGDKYTYSASDYGSVGVETEYSISDKSILKVSKNFKYDKPQTFGESGGDSGTTKYTFTALKKGKTTLTFRKIFREETYQKVIYIFEVK